MREDGSSIQLKELALCRIASSSSAEADGVLVKVLFIRCYKIISGLFVSHINSPEQVRLLS